MRYRKPRKTSKYWVEPEIFDNVGAFCRCYPLWVKELQTLPDGSRAIRYDKDKVQSSGDYDATAELAMKRVGIEQKVNLIESTAQMNMKYEIGNRCWLRSSFSSCLPLDFFVFSCRKSSCVLFDFLN